MPRPRQPEGKRITVCAKFSESEAAAIEVARGSMNRSEWVRLALLAAAERQQPPAGHVDRQAEAAWQNLAAMQGDCPHPPARVHKGMCHACGTSVTAKEGKR